MDFPPRFYRAAIGVGRASVMVALLAGAFVTGCAKPAERPAATKPIVVSSTATATAAPTAPAAFADEIAAFEAIDRSATPPPQHAVVFYGSSSFRMWKTLAADLDGTSVVNRGFGGSRVPDCIRYLDRAVVPLHPRMVVIYAGDNDLADGASPATVIASTRELFARLIAAFPDAPIVYVSVKPSPARAKLLPQAIEVNRGVRAAIDALNAGGHRAVFADVATPMLGPDGQPRPELFGPDHLHMNAAGYALWTAILKPIVNAAP